MKGTKKVIVTVTNDLVTDQRVHRTCSLLEELGYEVVLFGRHLATSKEVNRSYTTKRVKLLFNKGPLFYLCYTIRLFFYLAFNKFDAYWANDLDTFLPNTVWSKLRKKPLIYDAHEYFTEVPELVGRKRIQAIWKKIELFCIPFSSLNFTVSKSLVKLFNETYQTDFHLLRNVPKKTDFYIKEKPKSNIILYQGAINMGRGLIELIDVMPKIDAELWIAGNGDIVENVITKIETLKLNDKVKYLGNLTPEKLKQTTTKATIGVNLLENKGLNYYYSAANKFFDFVQAQLPHISMNFPEYQSMNEMHQVALLIDNLDLNLLTNTINTLLSKGEVWQRLHNNTKKAKEEWNWEVEKERVKPLIRKIIG